MTTYKMIIVDKNTVGDDFEASFHAEDGARLLEMADEPDFTGSVYDYTPEVEGLDPDTAFLVLGGMVWENGWCKDDVLLAFFQDDELVGTEKC